MDPNPLKVCSTELRTLFLCCLVSVCKQPFLLNIRGHKIYKFLVPLRLTIVQIIGIMGATDIHFIKHEDLLPGNV